MSRPPDFDPSQFLPYLLNRAAEEASQNFQRHYKSRYGMLRTEWRVLFHLGAYGQMTAKEICDRGSLHKTKVSRAVQKLEARRFVQRERKVNDRREENLQLTKEGARVYGDLAQIAQAHDAELTAQLSTTEARILREALLKLLK